MLWWIVSVTLAAPGDLDDDGVADAQDNCPGLANADQADANIDGWGDACVDTTAAVDATAELGLNTRVVGDSVVSARAILGDSVLVSDSAIGRRVSLGSNTEVRSSVVLRGGQVGADVRLTDATVSVFAVFHDGANVTSSVTHANVQLGRDSTATDALIGRNSRIGAEATVLGTVSPNGIVGFRSVLEVGSILRSRVTVASSATVGESARIGRDSFVGNDVRIGANARLRGGAFRLDDVADGTRLTRTEPVNHPPVLLDLSILNPVVSLGGSANATAQAFDREGDALSFEWSVNGAWNISGSGESVVVDAPRPDVAGFSDSPELAVSVESPTHQDDAEVGLQLTAPASCDAGNLPTGDTFILLPDSERRWYQVWCDDESHGGGWTIFHPSDIGHIGIDTDSLRQDGEQVLVWIVRNDGAQFTTLLQQLPQFAVHDITTSVNDRFLNVEFIPRNIANVRGATQGIRSNGSDLGFTNCDANPNSYLRFYQAGETAGNQSASNDYGMSYRWRDTKISAVSPIDADFFALTEFHQGGCGTFSTSNRWAPYDSTTGAALGIR